jgi:hypothetical protein
MNCSDLIWGKRVFIPPGPLMAMLPRKYYIVQRLIYSKNKETAYRIP